MRNAGCLLSAVLGDILGQGGQIDEHVFPQLPAVDQDAVIPVQHGDEEEQIHGSQSQTALEKRRIVRYVFGPDVAEVELGDDPASSGRAVMIRPAAHAFPAFLYQVQSKKRAN
jgi:hypothetical protein